MKKNRLTTDYPIDFELIGIVSPAKEYKLAWHINQLANIHLIKAKDIQIDFANNHTIRVSNMEMDDGFRSIYLLKNRLLASTSSSNQYLVSELQQFDYLLKISNQVKETWAIELISAIKAISVVDYAAIIKVEKIKMSENLFF